MDYLRGGLLMLGILCLVLLTGMVWRATGDLVRLEQTGNKLSDFVMYHAMYRSEGIEPHDCSLVIEDKDARRGRTARGEHGAHR